MALIILVATRIIFLPIGYLLTFLGVVSVISALMEEDGWQGITDFTAGLILFTIGCFSLMVGLLAWIRR